MAFKDLPPDSRPRERLLALGAGGVTDVELIALLLRTGFKGVSVLQLAQQLLDGFGGVNGMLRAPPEALRRALAQQLSRRPVFDSPGAVKDYARMQLGGLGHEVFALMCLDAQQQLLSWDELFRGTLTHTSVYPREVVKRALQVHASSVILAHNHPSGMAEPSPADESLTRHLQQALALVDVRVLDHLVVGDGTVVSFAERGMI